MFPENGLSQFDPSIIIIINYSTKEGFNYSLSKCLLDFFNISNLINFYIGNKRFYEIKENTYFKLH